MKDTLPGPATVDRSVGDAITRAQRGDPAAFESLYKAHSRRVYSVCLRMIRNPADAEDLTQQAFLQVFRKIGTFRGESGFSTWLHRVTVNVVLMHLRRKKPAEPLSGTRINGQPQRAFGTDFSDRGERKSEAGCCDAAGRDDPRRDAGNFGGGQEL
jgi:RNA polymerase sigma-70 factor, ECF subfamily